MEMEEEILDDTEPLSHYRILMSVLTDLSAVSDYDV